MFLSAETLSPLRKVCGVDPVASHELHRDGIVQTMILVR